MLAAEKEIGMWHIKFTENTEALSARDDGKTLTPIPMTPVNTEPIQSVCTLTPNTRGLLQGDKSKRKDKNSNLKGELPRRQ